MKDIKEFEIQDEFDGKTVRELYEEFLAECPMTDDAYINY